MKAASASLYLSPPSGSYSVGDVFYINIKVNSGGVNINAAEGTLVFNSEELQVITISKTNSIFNLWTTEPVSTGGNGSIVFGGGTPTNFNGTAGNIINIAFKAKKNATAQVNFSSGSVLAADGRGTNILSSMNGGTFSLVPKIITTPPGELPSDSDFPSQIAGTPLAPIISSITHPNANKWYSNDSPELLWELPSGVTAVRLLIDNLPQSTPSILYTPPISEKMVEDLSEGVWYFHARFRNQYGWGGVTHRKILIDTEQPELFEIVIDNQGDTTNPSPYLSFITNDSLSGVEYYEVSIDNVDSERILASTIDNYYQPSPQPSGTHSLIVKAIDFANNITTVTANFTVEPLEAPTIVDYSKTIRAEDTFSVNGTSIYPNAIITIFVKKVGEEEIEERETDTDEEGNWSFVHDETLEDGTYHLWAIITDSRGAKSEQTQKETLVVTPPPLLKIGRSIIEYLAVLISLLLLVIVSGAIIYYIWCRISPNCRRKAKKEAREAQESVTTAFRYLRKEVGEQIKNFDKKPSLSKEERAMRDKLRAILNASEKFIKKEIKDIEKELNK